MSLIFTRYNSFPDIFSNVFSSIFLQSETFVSECQICLAITAKRVRGRTPNIAGFYVSFAVLGLTVKATLNKM